MPTLQISPTSRIQRQKKVLPRKAKKDIKAVSGLSAISFNFTRARKTAKQLPRNRRKKALPNTCQKEVVSPTSKVSSDRAAPLSVVPVSQKTSINSLYDNLGTLPNSYDAGRLFFTARDPHWIYSYWDYSLLNYLRSFELILRTVMS